MTEVLHFPSSPSTTSPSPPLSSSSSSSSSSTPPPLSYAPSSLSYAPTSSSTTNTTTSTSSSLLIPATNHHHRLCNQNPVPIFTQEGDFEGFREEEEEKQLSLLALLIEIFRKSLVSCKSSDRSRAMEIGWPTNVRHVAHVTFDRFNGFLGLPVEFEPEVPRRAPSASATVFGVSTESMQLSYDSRGNCVPTILLLMQNCLYSQGGLQAEGIFRITAENSEEEAVRDQLNRGVIPEGVDVHCLAGLIKAWFRELPTGVLDTLSPERVMLCQTEEEYVELVRLLPPTEASLLDWAINLMADVVQHEHLNKMNSRNIAMVFAPNMTQMADPLTALMYAVQVMNFLKSLIERTLREREDSVVEPTPTSRLEPSDESGHQSPSQSFVQHVNEDNKEEDEETKQALAPEARVTESFQNSSPSNEISNDEKSDEKACDDVSFENPFADRGKLSKEPAKVDGSACHIGAGELLDCEKGKTAQSSNSSPKNSVRKNNLQQPLLSFPPMGKPKGISNLSRIDSRIERIEAWR